MVLWEKEIGSLAEGSSYKLAGVTVKAFGGTTYLSVGENCNVSKVDDIGQVADVEVTETKSLKVKLMLSHTARNTMVVLSVKPRSSDNYITGTCSKCGALMKLTKCIKYATAQVVVTAKDKVYTFTLFNMS